MAVSDVLSVISSVFGQTEIVLFLMAVVAHQFFFSKVKLPKNPKGASKLSKNMSPIKGKPSSPRNGEMKARDEGESSKNASEDYGRQVAAIKSAASKGKLQDAVAAFKACPKKTTVHYNALLDACVTCGDVAMADRVMSDAVAAKTADTTTYNTLMKVHLHSGDLNKARRAISEMTAAGFKPNTVTFNELLDATVSKNADAVWNIVDEMISVGAKPNHITCSILLKSVQPHTNHGVLQKTLQMVEMLDEPMDEVLLSSVIEACIRSRRTDLLKTVLHRQSTNQRVRVQSCHAYGSLIRAYGVMGDTKNVWATWKELRTCQVELTSITLGCMVEAVVTNTGPDGGYKFIREISADAQIKPLINAIMYGSILKGYSHMKKFDSVWATAEQMRKDGMQLSLTTYNTLVDACARCNEMGRVSGLLMEMASKGIKLNIITYSAIIKGYCQENRVDQALEVLKEMRSNPSLHPDEHTYNTVINGCARQGLYEKGVAILEEMCRNGIKPSNFTLSVLVKLASRSRKVDKAFELCEDLSKKYSLQLNVHVYNNLIQACVQHKGLREGFKVAETMLKQRVAFDVRTHTLLIRACIDAGESQDIAGVIRAAVGLRGEHPCLAGAAPHLLQPKGLPTELVVEGLEGISKRCRNQALATQLLKDLQQTGYKFDAQSMMRIMSC